MLNNVQITAENERKAKELFQKGVNLDPRGMDWMEVYGILALFGRVSMDFTKLHLIAPLEAASNFRNLQNEFPCTLNIAGVEFTLLPIQKTSMF